MSQSLVQVKIVDPSGAGVSGVMVMATYRPGDGGRSLSALSAYVTDVPVSGLTSSAGEALLRLYPVQDIGTGYGYYEIEFVRNGAPIMDSMNVRVTGNCDLSEVAVLP